MSNVKEVACRIVDLENWDDIEKITGLSDELDNMTMDEILEEVEQKLDEMSYGEFSKYEKEYLGDFEAERE